MVKRAPKEMMLWDCMVTYGRGKQRIRTGPTQRDGLLSLGQGPMRTRAREASSLAALVVQGAPFAAVTISQSVTLDGADVLANWMMPAIRVMTPPRRAGVMAAAGGVHCGIVGGEGWLEEREARMGKALFPRELYSWLGADRDGDGRSAAEVCGVLGLELSGVKYTGEAGHNICP
jgi:hypothetical protein